MPRTRKPKAVEFPVPVLIDTREQRPYTFDWLKADKRDGGGPLAVTTKTTTLRSGDYSLEGYDHLIAIERKSKADLFHTLAKGRERFERELDRLACMKFAAVVVECQWSDVFDEPPAHSNLNPKCIFRSVMAWQMRFPTVHWWFVPGRELAEVCTFRLLDRAVKEGQSPRVEDVS